MSNKNIKIPGRLESAAVEGVVAGADSIYDDTKKKSQSEINIQTDEAIGALDTKIDETAERISAEVENVDNKVDALQKQDIVVVDTLPAVADADPKKIYRLTGTDSYTDYMLNSDGSAFKAMATYSFPGIDDEPTAGSNNLVKSGGVTEKLSPFYNINYKEISNYQTINNRYIDTNGVVRSSSTFAIKYITLERSIRIKIKLPKLGNCSVCVSNTIPQLNGTLDEVLLCSSISEERTSIESTDNYSYLIWSHPTNYTDNIILIEDALGTPKEYITTENLQYIDDNFKLQEILEYRKRNIALKSDLRVPILVDWMQFSHGFSGISSTNVFNVVSSTTDTITLTTEDAAKFEANTPAIVVFPNNVYKLVFFNSVSNGTDIVKRPWDNTDLSNAIKIQSVFDTVMGVNGIHLSQYGYLALAQFTASELTKKTSVKNKNFIAGVDFYTATISDGIAYEDGIEVANYSCNFETTTKNYFQKVEGDRRNFTNGFGFLTSYLFVAMSNNNNYFEIDIPCKGSGFIEVQAGQNSDNTEQLERVTAQLYIDDVLSNEWELIGSQTKYTFENKIVDKSIKVKFIAHNVDAINRGSIALYSINFYESYPNVYEIGPSTNIAVLGDSWTQFPALANALPEMASYNSLVVRPDESIGDGCGYFTKELARITGANIDNWGKGSMRADNWGLVKIDELLAYKRYDYVIIEFFINDKIAGHTRIQWLNNISTLINKIKNAGAVPIVILPCRNNGQETYQAYRECVIRGFEAISY